MMRAWSWALLLLPAWGMAQSRLGYQGRLLRADGTPESRPTVQMTFTLYDAPTGGNAKWSESQQVGLTNGYYAVELGKNTAFPSTLADESALYLELAVQDADGGVSTLSPRQRVASVVWAMKATTAVNVSGGTVDATSVKVNGTTVLDSSGNLVGPAASQFASSAHTHGASEVVRGTFALERIPHGAGSGLDADLLDGLDSSAFATFTALSTPGTLNDPDNPVDWTRLKNVPPSLAAVDGGVAVVTDSTLVGNGTTGQPLGIDPNEVQRRIATSCAAGTVMQGVDVNGIPVCVADGDTNSGGTVTSVTAGAGLSGGTITESGTLAIATGGVTNAMLQNASLTVGAGTGLSGGGAVALGGATTLSLADTGVTAGSYTRANLTVDAQGRITAASSGGPVDLASEVTGTLAIPNGGTGATTAASALANLGAAPASGSASYIQNQTGSAQSAGFNVSGDGRIGGQLLFGNGDSRTYTRDNAGLIGSAGARSGFFETSAPSPAANWYPGASSWQHLLDVRHSNPANNFAMQFAGSFYDQNLYFRKTADNPAQGWSRVVLENPSGNVGIGTTSPSARLHVAGNLRIEDGTQGAGRVLTSDANGYASWQTAAGDISGVTAGFGLTGGATSGDASLAVNTNQVQARVTGTCAAGQSIRTINADGTVVCEVDDDTSNDFTPGSQLWAANDSTQQTTSTSYVLLKRTTVRKGGSFSVYFELQRISGFACLVYARIYKNGIPAGTERSTMNTVPTGYTETITGVNPGDNIEVYGRSTSGCSSPYATVSNFRLYVTSFEGYTAVQ